jgi:hypothetical protein
MWWLGWLAERGTGALAAGRVHTPDGVTLAATRRPPRWPLRELAGGRGDLLAEVAGILEGARESEPDEPLACQAAGLCRKAGADPEALPAWIAEGRRRRAAARQSPFSGGLR